MTQTSFMPTNPNKFHANPIVSEAREDHEEILRLTRGWGWRSLAAKPKNELCNAKPAKRR